MDANNSQVWVRTAALLKYREQPVGSVYEYDYFYFKDGFWDAPTGYKTYTSFVNPNNSWTQNTPGPVYTEESTYTVSFGTPDDFEEYEYQSRWGIDVNVTSTGGAAIDVDIDYNERDPDSTLGTSTENHSESKIVAKGTFYKLWANFKGSQAKYTSSANVTITP